MEHPDKIDGSFLNSGFTEELPTDPSSIIHKKARLAGLFRGLMFMGAIIGIGGCASTSSRKTDAMQTMRDIVSEIGAKYAGIQPDGSAITCEDGDEFPEAKGKAIKENEELLETTELEHSMGTRQMAEANKWIACVRSVKTNSAPEENNEDNPSDTPPETEKMQIMKKFIKELGYEYTGLQKDSTIIECAEGSTLRKARNKAKKTIRELLEGKFQVIGIKTKMLTYGNWVVAIHGKRAQLNEEAKNAMSKTIEHIRNRKFEDAVKIAEKTLKYWPDYADMWYILAYALRNLGKLDESINAYKRSIDLNPNSPSPYYSMGLALKAKGAFAEAAASFRRYAEMEKRSDKQYWIKRALEIAKSLEIK